MYGRHFLQRTERRIEIAGPIHGYLDGQAFPLLERFPELGTIPRHPLLSKPTAVDRFPELGKQIGYPDLWVKRDDQSSTPYGGNKPRKLEFLLGSALAKRYQSIVTVGGIGTNHGLATAIYAKPCGLETHLILCDQPLTARVRENLKLFHAFGATPHFAHGTIGAGVRAIELLARAQCGLLKAPCGFIGPGGTSPISTLGYINAAFELALQVKQGLLPAPSYLFCAAGSGGTMAGLVLGLRICGLATQVIGVRVSERLFTNRLTIAHLVNASVSLIERYQKRERIPRLHAGEIVILDGYLGAGYGAVTEPASEAVALAAAHGLNLETTYTGKTFAALRQFVRNLPSRAGPVLFWNTFNSYDLTSKAANVDYRELPRAFHRFFE